MSSNSQSFENIYQLNSGYVDDMFARFQNNPGSVSVEWRAYFNGFFDGAKVGSKNGNADSQSVNFELSVAKLVCAYKAFGHLKANVNPLASAVVQAQAPLAHLEEVFGLSLYGLSESDLTKNTSAGTILGLSGSQTLGNLIKQLEKTFCQTVGMECEYISSVTEREWLYSEFINLYKEPLSLDLQKKIYSELACADALEKTIATKYIGKKRFSIEGADTQIVAAESYMEELAKLGTQEFRIAIAHRGRLNFLVNVVGKPLAELFSEFEGYTDDSFMGDGDVKYHNGYESRRKTRSGQDIRIGLTFNPSHLEYAGPVVMGEARALQTISYNSDTSKMAAMIFHGDAAIAGQGVVYEAAQLMSLRGYNIGGVVHVVANNQVGFTTNPKDARSAFYCTNIARVTDSPVFHVNTDDIESVHRVMSLAARYRAQFKKDIYIDLLCFRRFGHNEGDEPSFTQPALYKIIKEKLAPFETYSGMLSSQKRFTEADLTTVYQKYRDDMNVTCETVKKNKTKITQFVSDRAKELVIANEKDILSEIDTSVSADVLQNIAAKFLTIPEKFNINPKIERLVVQERKAMMAGTKPLDWGMAELLAYGTLLNEGFSLRLTGEDVQRGTFSHRHAVLVDFENEGEYSLLKNINTNAKVEVINTLLSEEATMGYEYGYSATALNTLVLWEGQFGDFVNGAQVYLDQFLAAGETKWRQQQSLVLLLPHGMEGQGAEHSSARLERFLQLCAQGNMQVCYFTQATQIFHALRRQLKRKFRKPLVIMTPKSFLRSAKIGTTVEGLANSKFEEILDDSRISNPSEVERVLFCTGKIALDLFDGLESDEYKDLSNKVAVVRVEQLYPLHKDKLAEVVKKYPNANTYAWVQEEPKNMGAYGYIRDELADIIRKDDSTKQLYYFGRSARATPAVGFEKLHMIEQKQVIKSAFTLKESILV